MKHFKKWSIMSLVILMLMMNARFVMPVNAEDDNIASNKISRIRAYNPDATRDYKRLDTYSTYGYRMNFGAPFNKLAITLFTWSWSTVKPEVDISLYKWTGSFVESIQGTPVASTHLSKINSDSANNFSFDEQPAGEYLIALSDPIGCVGVRLRDSRVSKGYAYLGLDVEEAVDWEITVTFTKTPVEPFLPCESSNLATGDHPVPEEYVIPEDSLIYTHEVMPDTWVFTDGLGRKSLTNADVGDPREDRTLAMFFWTWHTESFAYRTPFPLQDVSMKYPEAANDKNHEVWNGINHHTFFWNEPIYGYYRSTDQWVLRRQAELLANAGVDVVFTDNSNTDRIYREAYYTLYDTWTDAMNDGVRTPKVSYLLPFNDAKYNKMQLSYIYYDIYRENKYQNLWFYWDGKPMIMGIESAFQTATSPLIEEVKEFFTFRRGQAKYLISDYKTRYSNWGWLAKAPQAYYYKDEESRRAGVVEQMSVGIALNHNYVVDQMACMSGSNVCGRSYTVTYENRYEVEGTEATKWGYNFAEQWNNALKIDPQVVFVTGWNEWQASRWYNWGSGQTYVDQGFLDTYNDEFSRDIEPTKGDLKDHYYYQLVNFVRQYKGARPIPAPSASKTIDLTAGNEQWKTVEPYYAAYIGNTDDRDAQGYADHYYTETSGRNDIIGAQMARDDEYIWFHVECNENITPYTDNLWMTLYIDCNQENQGWNTFDYVVNKSPAGENTLVLEKFTAADDYSKTEKVADVEYKVDGKCMTVKIAKADLDLSGNDYTVNFAWTDNVHDEGDYTKFSGDIMDFYISGDVAPGGRFKFSYISTEANSTVPETDTDSGEETPPATEEVEETNALSPDVTEPTTEATGKGCRSSLGVGGTALAAAAAAMLSRKKREDD